MTSSPELEVWMDREGFPRAAREAITRCYRPLATRVAEERRERGRPVVVGVAGAQGTGKSTLAGALSVVLAEHHGLVSAVLSIDDIYLTRAEREALGDRVHPLLATRGVPGTHDVALGIRTIRALTEPAKDGGVRVPRFDKAADDRLPWEAWPRVEGPVDVVIFEGWCIGAIAEDGAALDVAENDLERIEDPDGVWRRYVNDQLRQAYPPLFALVDLLVLLAAPSMESVHEWRWLQERKLAQAVTTKAGRGPMSESELRRFVLHFARLTRWMLEEMPARADVVIELDEAHLPRPTRGLVVEGAPS